MTCTNGLGAPGAPQAPGAPSTSTQTSVLERTETQEERSPGDRDRFAHFVRRDRVQQSKASRRPVIALCGKVWIPMRNPSKYPVCPRCKALRNQMGQNGPLWPYSNGGNK